MGEETEFIGFIGWAATMALVFAYQGFCLARPEWPALSDVLRAAMQYPAGRGVLFGMWLWIGWHLFGRGWRIFI